MTLRRAFTLAALAVSLAACSPTELFEEGFYEREAEGILPSSDPLLLAYFERELNDNGIAYSRDYTGKYYAVDHDQTSELLDLGEDMRERTLETGVLQVQKGCAAKKMQAYLEEEDVVYAVVLDDAGASLHLSQQDFDAHEIPQRWENYGRECGDEE